MVSPAWLWPSLRVLREMTQALLQLLPLPKRGMAQAKHPGGPGLCRVGRDERVQRFAPPPRPHGWPWPHPAVRVHRARSVIPLLLLFSLIQNLCPMPLLRAGSDFRWWGHSVLGVQREGTGEQRSGLCRLAAVVVVCKAAGSPDKTPGGGGVAGPCLGSWA